MNNSKKFIKDIDNNAKLYEIKDNNGKKMYIIKAKDNDTYIEVSSCYAEIGQPEKMIKEYLAITNFANIMCAGYWSISERKQKW